MEHKIFNYIRHGIQIPFFFRLVIWFFLISISGVPILLPIFPWSLFVWVFMLVVWILLIIPGKKVRHVIKLRKWIVYLFSNLHRKHIIKHKVKDIKNHVMEIIKEKKEKKLENF